MKGEVRIWIEKAEKDLKTAEYNYNGNQLEAAALFCQQSVEKALKSVFMHKNNKLGPKTHDVSFLAKKVGFPEEEIKAIEPLTSIYMEVRYPDVGDIFELDDLSVRGLLKAARYVLKWSKKQL